MKMAVVGLGFMGSTHLKAMRGVEGATLAAVCSNDEKALQGDLSGIQGNLGGSGERMDFSQIARYPTVAGLLDDSNVEAIDICLPTNMHADVAIEAMRRGKHVLVEKPMALDGEQCDRMVEAASRYRVTLMTAQVLRFFPAYEALRRSVSENRLGAFRTATFRRRCAAPAWGAGWLKDPALSGGGVFDLLIHDVDMTLHLFGVPEAIQATGFEDLSRGLDIINAEFLYAGGASAVVTGGWHHPKSYPFSMEYTVSCDRGTVEYNSAGRVPTLYGVDGSETPLLLADHDGYAREIAYFVECCQQGRQPDLCLPQDSAAAVKLTRLMLEARKMNGERLECKL